MSEENIYPHNYHDSNDNHDNHQLSPPPTTPNSNHLPEGDSHLDNSYRLKDENTDDRNAGLREQKTHSDAVLLNSITREESNWVRWLTSDAEQKLFMLVALASSITTGMGVALAAYYLFYLDDSYTKVSSARYMAWASIIIFLAYVVLLIVCGFAWTMLLVTQMQ